MFSVGWGIEDICKAMASRLINFGLFVRVIHDLQVTTLVRFHSFSAEVYIYTDVNDLVYGNDAPMTVRI